MEDEFLVYLKNKINDRLVMSFDNTDLLLWGTRTNSGVKLLGLTLTIGVKDLRTIKGKLDDPDERLSDVLEVASLLSRKSDSTFFVIGYSLAGGSSFRVTDSSDPLNWSKSFEAEEGEMPTLIEKFFRTDLGSKGTAKPVNKETSDWFHDWARENLPKEYVRTNIDGLILDKRQKPNIFLETKRSFIQPYSWEPFKNDSRNYYLQNLLATKTGLGFWTVYHKKWETVNDETKVALFVISGVSLNTKDKWITYNRLNTNASEVLKKI